MKDLRIIFLALIISILLVSCIRAPTKEEIIKWCPKPGALEDTEPSIPLIEIEEPEIEEPEDLSGLPTKEFKEGDLVGFPNLAKEDADGDPITYSFTHPLDENGEWQTEIGDAGRYKVTISAKDSKGAESTKDLVIVIMAVNKPPVIELSDVTVNEGESVSLDPKVSDPEEDEFSVEYSGYMTSSTKETGFEDSGSYKVTVTATDSKGAKTEKEISVTVNNVNRAPELSGLEDLSVKEGDKIELKPETSDADNDEVTVTFSDPLDSNGVWQTKVGDAASYDVTVTATDGTDTAEKTITITVTPLNRPPTLTLASEEITVQETETVQIQATAEDPDGDSVTISYSGWMSSATKETDYNSAGEYEVKVTATDSKGAKTEKTVKITITDKNRPPEIVI